MKKNSINFYVPFKKSDDETRMVYGYCTSEATDSQGEIVLRQAIVKAWDHYMEYANIREMHQASAVGVTKEFTHDENGTWIGAKVVDDRAWKFVQEGVYKGFSIGGRVTKRNKNIIEGIILAEISLVDRPANPDAKFSVNKVDDGLLDQLQLEANQFSNMKKYVEFEGVKYQEDPEKPGEALLVDGEKVALTAEELAAIETGGGEGEGSGEGEGDKGGEGEGDKGGEGEGEGSGEGEGAGEGAGEGQGAGEGSGEGSGEGEGEKAVTAEWTKKAITAGVIKKDSNGVIMLADLLSHLEYIVYCFKDSERDTGALEGIQKVLLKAIELETKSNGEKGANIGDLAKAMGSELSKAMAPVMELVGSLEKSVNTLKNDVDVIKNTRVAPRPKGNAMAVDKTIQGGADNATKSRAEAQKAVEAVEKEIDDFSKDMGEKVKHDATLTSTFMAKSAELHGKLSLAKRVLREAEEA